MITITRVKEATEEFIKVLRFGKSDVQTADQYTPHGVDSKPVKDALAIHLMTKDKGESVITGYINNSAITAEGETRIYATDSEGVEVFSMHFFNDGTVNFGGDADNLARFNELKAGFDQLTSDLNDFINIFNSHIHITTATVGTGPVGTIAPTTTTGTPTTADIDDAKIDEIKTL